MNEINEKKDCVLNSNVRDFIERDCNRIKKRLNEGCSTRVYVKVKFSVPIGFETFKKGYINAIDTLIKEKEDLEVKMDKILYCDNVYVEETESCLNGNAYTIIAEFPLHENI